MTKLTYFLSRVEAPRSLIRSAYDAHQALWMGYTDHKGESQPFRFRLDERGSTASHVVHLVQSAVEPNWLAAPGVAAQVQRVEFDLAAGQLFDFNVDCIVQRSQGSNLGAKRHKMPIRAISDIEKWMTDKADGCGFEILRLYCTASERRQFAVPMKSAPTADAPAGKSMHEFAQNVVNFNGVVKVVDANRFAACVQHGLGPKPALGVGMFAVMRLN